ncbi:AraC-like ligand-binding domain-containing protein [Streptomyces bambusae]|uniref:Helix-turn-helix domain-containing protein n=1 Tax=Streptomyces bambusae TaxID=1550616 RepID=A0ABS6Z4M2_9ACTN|nr:helix-turn-helix domain-containing protein [Streptomyces bambusae]MBW5482506.1 helix-turn-helix domain-containing protein [Streptomyces bambusae]
MKVVFDSCVSSPRERAEAWTETTALAAVTTRFRFLPGDDGTDSSARLLSTSLGSGQLSLLSYAALRSQRTPALIRRSDPEYYQVLVTLSGRQSIEQNRSTADLGAGDLVLYDSSRPFDAYADPGGAPVASVLVQFAKELLPFRDRQLGRLLATRLPARHGVGRLLTQFLVGLTEECGAWTPSDGPRLQQTALDLVGAVLAQHLDRPAGQPPDSRQRLLHLRVRAFIVDNLTAPGLSPSAVAAAHQISLRTLHRLFHTYGEPVGAFIRRQRLEHARRDLGDPALLGSTIHAIAARWGYERPADFTRAFRTAYGITPNEFRHLATTVAAAPAG